MNEQKNDGPFVYCEKDLKNKPETPRWKSRLTNGKEVIATMARKTKFGEVKDFDQRIKEIEDRIEANEIANEKKTITAAVYDSTRQLEIHNLQMMKHSREIRAGLNYLGQQADGVGGFLGFLPDAVKRDRG